MFQTLTLLDKLKNYNIKINNILDWLLATRVINHFHKNMGSSIFDFFTKKSCFCFFFFSKGGCIKIFHKLKTYLVFFLSLNNNKKKMITNSQENSLSIEQSQE